MHWVAILTFFHVAAQSTQPLLPAGVSIAQVTQIQTYISGTVQFAQSTDGSATYSTLLKYPVTISFDNMTGILSVTSAVASTASFVKPGLLAAFLALGLCLSLNPNKNGAFLCVLLLGLGVVTAGSVTADFVITVPGCWHTANGGTMLLFDNDCLGANTTNFVGVNSPLPLVQSSDEWTPIDPATSFLPANDHGMHTLPDANQYEVWRSTFGRAADGVSFQNFLDFTARCRLQNQNATRDWTAGCNQFSDLSHDDWKTAVLADNAAILNAANNGRRLLEEVEVVEFSESERRKLLAVTSFSWVGTGKLTPVKDQGQCGSCYAHSTSSQMEASLAITYGTVPFLLAREQLKDCSSGAPGCNGGNPAYMFTYAAGATGLGTEAALPYHYNTNSPSTNIPCSTPPMAFSNTGYIAISNNEAAFQIAVQKAPIAVTVCADTWDNYAGGVFSNCATGCNVDHAVLLVGFGTDSRLGDYWLIQNSWNTWWGESGFIRLPNTHSSTQGVGMCGLTTWPGYQAANPKGSGLTPSSAAPSKTPTAAAVSPAPTSSTATVAPTVAPKPCQGSWSLWSSCSKSCGGGVQSRTWTTTSPPIGTGAACPNPTTVTQSCNRNVCPSGSGNCVHVSNSVLSASGDGDYTKVADWNQGWCGTATNPQYQFVNGNGQTIMLFWYATNCLTTNGVPARTAGVWGLGPAAIPRAAYQWSGSVATPGGVVPGPESAPGWTISISTGTTCASG